MRHYELTDDEWAQILHLLPGRVEDPGDHEEDNRLFVDAVIWIARRGAPWRDPPERFGLWNSVFQRFNRRSKAGVATRRACTSVARSRSVDARLDRDSRSSTCRRRPRDASRDCQHDLAHGSEHLHPGGTGPSRPRC